MRVTTPCLFPARCERWSRLYDEEDSPLTAYARIDAGGVANLSWSYGRSPSTLTAHVAIADATRCILSKPVAATPTWRARVERFGASNRGSNHDEDGSLPSDDDAFRRLRPSISNVSIASSAARVCRGALPSEVAAHFLFLQSDAEVAGFADVQSADTQAECYRWSFPPTSRTLLACLALENTLLCSARYDLAAHRMATAEEATADGAIECDACFGTYMNDRHHLVLRLVATPLDDADDADARVGAQTCASYELYARTAADAQGGAPPGNAAAPQEGAPPGNGAAATPADEHATPALLGYARDAPLRLQLPPAVTAPALHGASLVRAYALCSSDAGGDGSGGARGGALGARTRLLTATLNLTALMLTHAHTLDLRQRQDGQVRPPPTADATAADDADGGANTSARVPPWLPPMCVDCERSDHTATLADGKAARRARSQKEVFALCAIFLALYTTLRACDQELMSAVRTAAHLAVRLAHTLQRGAAHVQVRVQRLGLSRTRRQPLREADAAASAAAHDESTTEVRQSTMQGRHAERPAIELAVLT